jgi:HlyD family secretion protein
MLVADKITQLKSLRLDAAARTEEAPGGSRWPVLVAAALGGAVLAGALVWALKPAPKPVVVAEAAPAAESAAKPAPVGDLIASGYVVARRRATVAAEITGRVIDVRVEEGMAVTRGQLLAVLDSDLARTERRTAQSRVTSAGATIAALRADLADAQRIAERSRQLAKDGYASTADLTRAQTRVASLMAQIDGAEANRATAQSDLGRIDVQLSKYEIRAPFTGIVVDKNAQPGEIISPISAGGGFTRTGICTLVDMNSLEIEVDVNEAFIGRVKEGMKVDAVLDAYPDVTLPAIVIATVPTANREKATVRVRIGFIGRDARVLPDMAIKVTFREDKA